MQTDLNPGKIRGYKVLNPDWTCRGFKFDIGQTYIHNGPVVLCTSGFHFCDQVSDCFNYYQFDPKNIVVEVEATDYTQTKEDSKRAARIITVLSRLSWENVLRLANSGYGNSGNKNSGNGNSGYGNSGNGNSGNGNSGYRNSGDCNSGNRNSGNGNSGNGNSGYGNSGYGNSGNGNSGYRNSGDCNSGNRNSGYFNTDEPTIRLFNRDSGKYRHELDLPNICPILNEWVSSENMTDAEKLANPSHTITGGFYRTVPYKAAWAKAWANSPQIEKDKLFALPNFDAAIFEEITGIKV